MEYQDKEYYRAIDFFKDMESLTRKSSIQIKKNKQDRLRIIGRKSEVILKETLPCYPAQMRPKFKNDYRNNDGFEIDDWFID